MRKYRKVLLLGCLCGILCVFSDMVNMEEVSLSQIILRTTFSQTWYHAGFIMSIMKMFIPLLLFQILCGSMIYRYFCCASVYYFTRNASRIKWFLLECAKLYLTCLSFLIIMILTGTAALLLVGKVTIDCLDRRVLSSDLFSVPVWVYSWHQCSFSRVEQHGWDCGAGHHTDHGNCVLYDDVAVCRSCDGISGGG